MTLGCFDWRDRLSFEGFLTPKKQWRNRFQAYIYIYVYGPGFSSFFCWFAILHPFPSFFCCWERSRSFNDKRDTDTHNPSFSSKVFEVKEFDCNLTREMVDLIDREADMLNRGRPEKSFAGRQGMGKKGLFDWGSWGVAGFDYRCLWGC